MGSLKLWLNFNKEVWEPLTRLSAIRVECPGCHRQTIKGKFCIYCGYVLEPTEEHSELTTMGKPTLEQAPAKVVGALNPAEVSAEVERLHVLEKMLRRVKIEIVGDYGSYLPQVTFTEGGEWEVELLDKIESLMGPLECPVDKEEVEQPEAAVFCPICLAPYHQDCAKLLASRGESCWRCERFNKFDLVVG